MITIILDDLKRLMLFAQLCDVNQHKQISTYLKTLEKNHIIQSGTASILTSICIRMLSTEINYVELHDNVIEYIINPNIELIPIGFNLR